MRNRPNATWHDLAAELEVTICEEGPATCRTHWSPWIHRVGRVDAIGVLHWSGSRVRSTRMGLRKFLLWAAYAKNKEIRRAPKWQAIHLANIWAFRTAKNQFHYQIPWEHTVADRRRVARLAAKAGVDLHQHPKVRRWVYWKPSRARMKRSRGAMNG